MKVSTEDFKLWLEKRDRPRKARVSAKYDPELINRYLPGCYQVTGKEGDYLIIEGVDVAGWTLDDYVIPRLWSGLIRAEEITEKEES